MTSDPDDLLTNVHSLLLNGEKYKGLVTDSVNGTYAYYHYLCDGLNDTGWGCGYRTCQTICSWIHYQNKRNDEPRTVKNKVKKISGVVPSIPEMQDILVELGDKPPRFRNSKEWIGSVEIAMCIDYVYDVPCKLVHVLSGHFSDHIQLLREHFKNSGCPVMMGGDSDNASKGILAVTIDPETSSAYLLILDPHCSTRPHSAQDIVDWKFVSWIRVCDLDQSSFYNLCLPQIAQGK